MSHEPEATRPSPRDLPQEEPERADEADIPSDDGGPLDQAEAERRERPARQPEPR